MIHAVVHAWILFRGFRCCFSITSWPFLRIISPVVCTSVRRSLDCFRSKAKAMYEPSKIFFTHELKHMCTNGVKNASVNWWAANLRSLFTYAETSYALTRPLKSYSPLISIIDKITKRRVISPVLFKINKYTCVR